MANILIVDDSPFMQTVLRDLLVNLGHQVVGEARDGREAVAQFVALRPELVAMDLKMPQTDGLSAIRQILLVDPQARIVVVSAQKHPDTIAQAMEAGAKDFLVKPLNLDQVARTIEQVLAPA